jgi:hypothetical protein
MVKRPQAPSVQACQDAPGETSSSLSVQSSDLSLPLARVSPYIWWALPQYISGGEVRLHGYTDYDWEGSAVDRLSTLGCCFNLGSITISGK